MGDPYKGSTHLRSMSQKEFDKLDEKEREERLQWIMSTASRLRLNIPNDLATNANAQNALLERIVPTLGTESQNMQTERDELIPQMRPAYAVYLQAMKDAGKKNPESFDKWVDKAVDQYREYLSGYQSRSTQFYLSGQPKTNDPKDPKYPFDPAAQDRGPGFMGRVPGALDPTRWANAVYYGEGKRKDQDMKPKAKPVDPRAGTRQQYFEGTEFAAPDPMYLGKNAPKPIASRPKKKDAPKLATVPPEKQDVQQPDGMFAWLFSSGRAAAPTTTTTAPTTTTTPQEGDVADDSGAPQFPDMQPSTSQGGATWYGLDDGATYSRNTGQGAGDQKNKPHYQANDTTKNLPVINGINIKDLQGRLKRAGLLRSDYAVNGNWDDETIAAWEWLLEFANREVTTWEAELSKLEQSPVENSYDKQKKAASPKTVSVTDSMSLRSTFNQVAEQVYGRKLSPEELDRMVNAYHGLETSVGMGNLATNEVGGVTTSTPDPTTWATQDLENADPGEAFGQDFGQAYNDFMNLIRGTQ